MPQKEKINPKSNRFHKKKAEGQEYVTIVDSDYVPQTIGFKGRPFVRCLPEYADEIMALLEDAAAHGNLKIID